MSEPTTTQEETITNPLLLELVAVLAGRYECDLNEDHIRTALECYGSEDEVWTAFIGPLFDRLEDEPELDELAGLKFAERRR